MLPSGPMLSGYKGDGEEREWQSLPGPVQMGGLEGAHKQGFDPCNWDPALERRPQLPRVPPCIPPLHVLLWRWWMSSLSLACLSNHPSCVTTSGA